MPDGDEQTDPTPGPSGAPAGTGWSPEVNPVESFTSTIDQAVRQLSLELAAIRAERDGLRLELEGLRAQYELLRMQVHDRDRFQATVRELGEIVRRLNVPVSWTEAAVPTTHAPSVEPTVPLAATAPAPAPAAEPPLQARPAADAPQPPPAEPTAPPVEPAAPTFAMPPVQPPAAAPTAWAFEAAPEPPAADPFAWAAPNPEQPEETDWSSYLGSLREPLAAPPPAEPVAPPVAPGEPAAAAAVAPAAQEPVVAPVPPAEPFAAPAAAPPSPEPVVAAEPAGAVATPPPAPEPEPEPAAVAAPAPEPEPTRAEPAPLQFTLRPETARDDQPRTQSMALPTIEEGVWQLPEPGRTKKERRSKAGLAVNVAKKGGSIVAGILIVAVLLVAVGPKVLPYQTFFVRSGSMEPAIEVGELIFLTKVEASDLGEGDVITFERPDRPGVMVTHRIVAVETTDTGGKVFQTKGDANGSPDTWRVPAVGDGWKYAFGVPKLGYVFGYLNTPQARLAMLVIPAVVLGLLSLIDIWKPKEPKQQHARRRR